MFTLKHVAVFIILQNSVYSWHLDDSYFLTKGYYESEESTEEYYINFVDTTDSDDVSEEEEYQTERSETKLEKLCPEEFHSLLSHSDLKYLIEKTVETLKIKENFVQSYYPETTEIFEKYTNELEEFQKKIEDRPKHLLHLLDDIASLRQKLEPGVEDIETKLEEFDSLENNYNEVAERSNNTLNQLDKIKNICEINCNDHIIENRFAPNAISNYLIVSKSAGMYCIRLKDFNENIHEKLSEVLAQYDEDSNHQLEIRDHKISEFKNNLKEAAVKQFGMTMYDILSLQDDYHHFAENLDHVNISMEIQSILENTAEIELKLIRINRNLDKFRQYCMKCSFNQRIKRSISDLLYNLAEDSNIYSETTDAETDIVDRLIKDTINEIRQTIKMNYTAIFEDLDEKLSNPDFIDLYVTRLHPIQDEIKNAIEMEQEAFNRLNNRIPEASMDKIFALSKESEQMIQNLEAAKQYIDQFLLESPK